jgi:hypothetical protein
MSTSFEATGDSGTDKGLGRESSSAGTLLRRLFHALLEQHVKLLADLPGLALEFVQELALFVINLAVGEEHLPQPGGLLGVDPAVRQDVVLDGLVEELLEGRGAVLHPLVQLDEEVGLPSFDLAAGVQLSAQRL